MANQTVYQSPTMEIKDVCLEGILCASYPQQMEELPEYVGSWGN